MLIIFCAVCQIEVRKWENYIETVFHQFRYLVPKRVNSNFQTIFVLHTVLANFIFGAMHRPSLNIIETLTNCKIIFTLKLQTYIQLLVHTTVSRYFSWARQPDWEISHDRYGDLFLLNRERLVLTYLCFWLRLSGRTKTFFHLLDPSVFHIYYSFLRQPWNSDVLFRLIVSI